MQCGNQVVVLLALLVVLQHALLHRIGGHFFVDVFFAVGGKLRRHFQRVVGAAAVAAGVAGHQLQRVVIRGDFHCAEAALLVLKRLAQQLRNRLVAQRLQYIHAAARKQCGDDFKRWILRGRANQPDRAPLHVRQKRILLRLVEAVNFVHEQNRARVHLRGLLGSGHHLLNLLDAAHHRGKLNKVGLRGLGNNLGQRGFAHARRAPENHRPQLAAPCRFALNLHPQRLARPQQMLLPAILLQRARPHTLGQRCSRPSVHRPSGCGLGAFRHSVE